MKTKIFVTVIMLIVLVGLSADNSEQFVRLVNGQRDSFLNIRNLLRTTPAKTQRNGLLEEIVIQQYHWVDEHQQMEWFNDEKLEYSYNESNLLESVTWYSWIENEERNWSLPILTANIEWLPNNQLSSLSYLIYSHSEEDWIEYMRMTHQYNEMNQITEAVMEMFDHEGEVWVLDAEVDFAYNENDMLETIIMTFYDNEQPSYRQHSRDRMNLSYDDNGRLSLLVGESEFDGDWVNSEMNIIEYHPNDNSSYSNLQDFINNFALIMTMDDYETFNPFGQVEIETFFEWEAEDWQYLERDLFFYDEYDRLEIMTYEDYDSEEQDWIASNRYLINYDEYGQLEEVYKQWANWDGMIDWSEANAAGVNFQYRVTPDGMNLECIVTAPTTGWVAVGFNPTFIMRDANIIIAYVDEHSQVMIRDDWGTGNNSHESDLVLGGTDDVTLLGGFEADGITTIHFFIPLDSGDVYDQPLAIGQSYPIILARGSNGEKNFTSVHAQAGTSEITILEPIPTLEWQHYERIFYTYPEPSSVESIATTPSLTKVVNYPNPFNPETTLSFYLPENQSIELGIFNIKGQLVKTLTKDHYPAGNHKIVWNGIDAKGQEVSSGVYFYKLITEDKSITGKMMLLK